MAKANYISVSAFARLIGVSHTAVQKAIKAGRLLSVKNGKVDEVKGKLEWEQNTDLSKRREPQAEAKPAKKEKEEPPPLSPEEIEELAEDEKQRKESGRATKSYNVARAVKEEYAARMAKLDFETRAGTLVSTDKVRLEQFQSARLLRDTLLNMPDKISHELAAEVEPDKVHILLKKHLHAALEELYAEGKRRAARESEEEKGEVETNE